MKDFSAIIERFGISSLAEMFGVEESHVRVMKARNSIPPEYWGVLIERAPVEDGAPAYDFTSLRQMRDERFAKPASRPKPRSEQAVA